MAAQLSPGDLAEVHAHLEGLSNCTRCHVLNQKVSNDKCLDCHELLNSRIAAGKGYHASTEVKGKECIACHSDHHGRKFQMIRFDTAQFDHRLTGYELAGAHSRLSCGQCHRDTHIADPEIRKLSKTYLGLQQACLSCHEDYHDRTLSVNCFDCHSADSFREIPHFDHSRTAFPLSGKHVEVECNKCHPTILKDGRDFRVFKGIEHGSCVDCHEDVHNNKFGQDCKKCHTVQSFHQVIGMGVFDHSRTGYPLEGMHLSVACEKCHPVNYTTPLPHNSCMDCHDDYHRSQFEKEGKVPDCANCHTVDGFRPSTFTVENHRQVAFALEGAHLATPCFSCHKKTTRWEFRNIGSRCADCHEDIHRDYLSPKYYPEQDCKSCHALESWVQIGFDHNLTSYALTGGHRGPSCRACHQQTLSPGKNVLRFSGISDKCVTCHDDQHAGQFVVDGFIDCARCHDNKNWKANLFDHDRSRFPLDGRHNQLACSACHKPVLINGVNTVQYLFEDIRCESCHK